MRSLRIRTLGPALVAGLAWARVGQEDYDGALADFERALELADRERHPANRARILTRLALVDGAEAKPEVGLQRSR